jgi:hypothetical protein
MPGDDLRGRARSAVFQFGNYAKIRFKLESSVDLLANFTIRGECTTDLIEDVLQTIAQTSIR